MSETWAYASVLPAGVYSGNSTRDRLTSAVVSSMVWLACARVVCAWCAHGVRMARARGALRVLRARDALRVVRAHALYDSVHQLAPPASLVVGGREDDEAERRAQRVLLVGLGLRVARLLERE